MMERPKPNGNRVATPREVREAVADLQVKLSLKRCEHCATLGLWTITGTVAQVRYITCGACGKAAKLVT